MKGDGEIMINDYVVYGLVFVFFGYVLYLSFLLGFFLGMF